MRKRLLIALVIAACASIWMSVPAGAGPIVDPSALVPPPPPGATCKLDGAWTICQTTFDDSHANVELEDFDLPCGAVYETMVDVRAGIRWYADGKLVKRFVSQNAEGTWSLSPTGAGPKAIVTLQANWRDEYAVPGDESSASTTVHGSDVTVRASGYGVIVHIAGVDRPDDTHQGVATYVDDPSVSAELCDALSS
jgi:hypothetical protein